MIATGGEGEEREKVNLMIYLAGELNLGLQLEGKRTDHCTEVRFASFLSGGFIAMALINPLERKLVKRTSVHCIKEASS